MYFCGRSPDFFLNFHILTTEVIPYNALNSEFANSEAPCMVNFQEIKIHLICLRLPRKTIFIIDCSTSTSLVFEVLQDLNMFSLPSVLTMIFLKLLLSYNNFVCL
jgi:hypothetical protein